MTINGKRDHFTRADLVAVGESISVSRLGEILDEIVAVVADWPKYARQAGVDTNRAKQILETLRLELGSKFARSASGHRSKH